MPVRKLIFLDNETWAHLKYMAGSDTRSTSNFIQVLLKQEWEARQSNSREPGFENVAPKIPPDFHVKQV